MLVNARTEHVVAEHVELADTRASRRRGLLGRSRLDPSRALILIPCFSIHTAFMRFAIDVVFVDRQGVVVRVVENIRPWRLSVGLRAHAAIELAAGTAASTDVRRGDRLYVAAPTAGAARLDPMTAVRTA
jgi:uncharacterized membrane protein (UPF0127 family)